MATLDDIARRTGLSAATVSNVMRGRGSFGAGTAARVRAAARELGYRPNLSARALAERRAPTIALFVTNIANPFYPQFAVEAEHAARRRDRMLIVCNAARRDGTLDTAYLASVAGPLAEGLILLGSDLGHDDLLSSLPPGVPAVLSTWEDPDAYPTRPSVNIDFRTAGKLAAAHLLELGHREIGVLAGGQGRYTFHGTRFASACATLRDAGIAVDGRHVAFDDDTIGGGYRAAAKLLDHAPDLTALLATNDLLAIGALQAAAERGLKVPGELSVIGMTDIWMAAEMRPALTTVDISAKSLAEGSVNLLLDLIDDPDGVSQSALRVVGSPRLVRRASTAPPRTTA